MIPEEETVIDIEKGESHDKILAAIKKAKLEKKMTSVFSIERGTSRDKILADIDEQKREKKSL